MPPGNHRKLGRRLPGTYHVQKRVPGARGKALVIGGSVFTDVLQTGKKLSSSVINALKPALPVLKTIAKTLGKEGLKLLPELLKMLNESAQTEISKGKNKTANKYLSDLGNTLTKQATDYVNTKGEDTLNNLIGDGLQTGGALLEY